MKHHMASNFVTKFAEGIPAVFEASASLIPQILDIYTLSVLNEERYGPSRTVTTSGKGRYTQGQQQFDQDQILNRTFNRSIAGKGGFSPEDIAAYNRRRDREEKKFRDKNRPLILDEGAGRVGLNPFDEPDEFEQDILAERAREKYELEEEIAYYKEENKELRRKNAKNKVKKNKANEEQREG